jgi:hypothetical protein
LPRDTIAAAKEEKIGVFRMAGRLSLHHDLCWIVFKDFSHPFNDLAHGLFPGSLSIRISVVPSQGWFFAGFIQTVGS